MEMLVYIFIIKLIKSTKILFTYYLLKFYKFYYHHSHPELSNEFLSTCIRQDLLRMPHPLHMLRAILQKLFPE